MKVRLTLIMVALLLALMSGCSEEQKEDAAALEQELLDREGADVTDTATEVDTAPETESAAMDVEAIPEEEEEVTVPTGPAGSGWVVQVAACEESDYANYLVTKYTERGYTPYVTTYNHLGQLYYRVRLGPFDTQAEAERLKMELVDKYSVTGWIALEG